MPLETRFCTDAAGNILCKRETLFCAVRHAILNFKNRSKPQSAKEFKGAVDAVKEEGKATFAEVKTEDDGRIIIASCGASPDQFKENYLNPGYLKYRP